MFWKIHDGFSSTDPIVSSLSLLEPALEDSHFELRRKKRKYFTLQTVETAVPYHQDYRKNRRGRRAVLQSGITCKRSNAWLRFKWCLLGLQVTPTCTPIRPLFLYCFYMPVFKFVTETSCRSVHLLQDCGTSLGMKACRDPWQGCFFFGWKSQESLHYGVTVIVWIVFRHIPALSVMR